MASDIEAEIIELYERHVEGIYCFCICRLYVKDLAEEATSEVFLKLVEKYPVLRKTGKKKKIESNVRKWLYGTARNAISQQIRQVKRRQETQKGVIYTKGNDVIRMFKSEEPVEFDDIYKAIGQLSAQDQEIVVHRFIKGLHTSEIAERMGIKHGTVRVRLSRAIRTLRNIMGTNHV